MADPTKIKSVWDKIIEKNPELPFDDVLEFTCRELGTETIEVVEAVFPSKPSGRPGWPIQRIL